MQTYIVGGYVRDTLLGLDPHDKDWVVVDATPENLLQQGYQLVGDDFPVFLHPVTHEAYSLARSSRKQHRHVQNRRIYTSTDITLEQDLARRDLTINAMAMTADGKLVDPFNGKADLQAGILRHINSGFQDDPVRVLRTARFAARYNFSIAPETQTLIRQMIDDRQLDYLVPERVWAELHKALSENRPEHFIHNLRELGALAPVFPEIDCLFGIPQPERHHPEIDTGTHLLMTLEVIKKLSPEPLTRFGALVHDLGKCMTDKEKLPQHIGHEEAGVNVIRKFCQRLRSPGRFQEFGELCSRYHLHVHRAFELKPNTLVKLFEQTSAYRQDNNFMRLLMVCQADAQGRSRRQNTPYPQANYLKQVFRKTKRITTNSIDMTHIAGKAIGQKLHQMRVGAARSAKKEFQMSENN